MPKVKIRDINIYYEIHGEGEPLFMINGAGGTVDWVRRLIPIYSREYRLVLFDNRGAGQSDKPDMAYSTAMLADDLAGLLDAIGIDSAHVRGVSFGGMIAQEFALRHPKKVKSLVLMVTSCGQPHSIMSSSADLSKAHELPPKEATEALLRCFITAEFIEKQPKLFQTLVAFALEHPIDPDCLAKHTDAIKRHDTYDRLPEISAPTLVIGGDADTVIPAENAHILASRIPRAELVILKNAGHMLIEAAQDADRLTLDFLKRHRIVKRDMKT